MQAQLNRSSTTSLTSSVVPANSLPIRFEYDVHRELPLHVKACIGDWWPGERDGAIATFRWDGTQGNLWVPWEHAVLPLIAHEAVHLGQWVGEYARRERVMDTLLPRAHFKRYWTNGFDHVQDEIAARATENFLGRFIIKAHEAGYGLHHFLNAGIHLAFKYSMEALDE